MSGKDKTEYLYLLQVKAKAKILSKRSYQLQSDVHVINITVANTMVKEIKMTVSILVSRSPL